jgi:hypothetical protein
MVQRVCDRTPVLAREPAAALRRISRVPRFSLTTNCEDEYRVYLLYEPIQRYVAVSSTPDHQLPEVSLDRPADQRILLEDVDCADDLTHPRGCIVDLVREQMVQDTIEVLRQLRREFDPAHTIAPDGAV